MILLMGIISLSVEGIRHIGDDRKKHATIGESKCIWISDDKVGHTMTIPAGFITDGSSGGPDVGWAWLFHDWLYATHRFDDGSVCTRAEADTVMDKILAFERFRLYRIGFRIALVFCRCRFEEAWENSGRRGPVFLEE